AAARQCRPPQARIGGSGMKSSGERSLAFSRDFDGDEVRLRIQVVLLRLIDDANVSLSGRLRVGQTLVHLVQLQVLASGVANAKEKSPLSSRRNHQSTNRLTFMLTRPIP